MQISTLGDSAKCFRYRATLTVSRHRTNDEAFDLRREPAALYRRLLAPQNNKMFPVYERPLVATSFPVTGHDTLEAPTTLICAINYARKWGGKVKRPLLIEPGKPYKCLPSPKTI